MGVHVKDFSIVLHGARVDSQGFKIYRVGEKLTGLIVIAGQINNISGLKLILAGRARSYWKELTGEENKELSFQDEDKCIYLLVDLDIENSIATRKEYSFEFSLPAGLPSSFDGLYGDVTYSLTAILEMDARAVTRSVQKEFKLDGYLNLKQHAEVLEPLEINVTKHMLFGIGHLGLYARLNKSGFLPGELTHFDMRFTNECDSKIQVNLFLLRETTYRASENKITHTEIVGTVEGPVVDPHSVKGWKGDLVKIPFDCTAVLSNCKIIEMQYRFLIEMDIPGPHMNLEGTIPTMIGTVASDTPLAPETDAPETPEIVNTPEPAPVPVPVIPEEEIPVPVIPEPAPDPKPDPSSEIHQPKPIPVPVPEIPEVKPPTPEVEKPEVTPLPVPETPAAETPISDEVETPEPAPTPETPEAEPPTSDEVETPEHAPVPVPETPAAETPTSEEVENPELAPAPAPVPEIPEETPPTSDGTEKPNPVPVPMPAPNTPVIEPPSQAEKPEPTPAPTPETPVDKKPFKPGSSKFRARHQRAHTTTNVFWPRPKPVRQILPTPKPETWSTPIEIPVLSEEDEVMEKETQRSTPPPFPPRPKEQQQQKPKRKEHKPHQQVQEQTQKIEHVGYEEHSEDEQEQEQIPGQIPQVIDNSARYTGIIKPKKSLPYPTFVDSKLFPKPIRKGLVNVFRVAENKILKPIGWRIRKSKCCLEKVGDCCCHCRIISPDKEQDAPNPRKGFVLPEPTVGWGRE